MCSLLFEGCICNINETSKTRNKKNETVIILFERIPKGLAISFSISISNFFIISLRTCTSNLRKFCLALWYNILTFKPATTLFYQLGMQVFSTITCIVSITYCTNHCKEYSVIGRKFCLMSNLKTEPSHKVR